MPVIKAGDVAPHDLREISGFLRNLNQANISVHNHPEVIQDLMDIAELSYDSSIPTATIEPPKEEEEELSEEAKKYQQLELELIQHSLEILKSESN
jgi:hypothetical protein